jgi:hypothetical protein
MTESRKGYNKVFLLFPVFILGYWGKQKTRKSKRLIRHLVIGDLIKAQEGITGKDNT